MTSPLYYNLDSLCWVLQFDILNTLHPSPAVCGLPTEEARQFIRDYGMCLYSGYNVIFKLTYAMGIMY